MGYASEQGVLNSQWNAANMEYTAAFMKTEPSYLFRPKLTIDGDRWCALYGDDLQNGVAGFGKSPEKAMEAFDLAWKEELKS